MRCLVCNKIKQDGIWLYGVQNKYKVCKQCLNNMELPIRIQKVFISEKSQARYETKMQANYLQEKLDEKLWEWLR